MALIRIKTSHLNNVINDMVNNTGTSRTNEYYFDARDLPLGDVLDFAFEKKIILTITTVYSSYNKITFNLILT